MADYEIDLIVKAAKSPTDELLEKLRSRQTGEMLPRAPVVTFLGHVDHGKTSLMDRIRNTGVAKGEAGGITQHIGAYRLDREGSSDVVFLDTPGHEAFTAMRARGANMTDVVVLVVAADDGVMPQTIEAISHAKAASVPIVVALNKIDLPNANVQRAMGQLAEHDLQPRQWGGDVEVIETSAETGEGIDSLVEILALEAELLELAAEVSAPAEGYVIEAEMDSGYGVLTRLLVLNGTLKIGDTVLAGRGYGHVRSLRNDHGENVTEAGPATPIEVAGLDEVPEAGDRFYVVDDIDQARPVAEQLRQDARTKELAAIPERSLEALLSQIESGEAHELAVIIKADVQGSVEAITSSISKLGTDETKVKILHAAVGGISTGDVTLAEASDAIIIGFNVVPDSGARQLAKERGIDVRLHRVIYDLIEEIRTALEEGLTPEIHEETLGQAEVRQVFKISRIGTVAGCLATDGVVQRNAKVRIIRDQVIIEDDRSMESLKRFKDDAREVRAGLECGIKIAGYNDVKEGDILEFYQQIEVARTL
jgi:translation initiation factor IF-2